MARGLGEHVPETAPYIWHVKHYKRDTRAVLPYLPRPRWVPADENAAKLNRTVEFWFALRGGGAMAHADGHCGSIVSVQLGGRKRWRLMFLPELRGVLDKFGEEDGGTAFEGGHGRGQQMPAVVGCWRGGVAAVPA